MKLGFIVEGTNDEKLLREVNPSFEVVVTHGTRLNNAIKRHIERMSHVTDRVYILTDPDEAGGLIAARLEELYGYTRVHVDPEKCKKYLGRGKWKIGVEHANVEYLHEVFDKLFILK